MGVKRQALLVHVLSLAHRKTLIPIKPSNKKRIRARISKIFYPLYGFDGVYSIPEFTSGAVTSMNITADREEISLEKAEQSKKRQEEAAAKSLADQQRKNDEAKLQKIEDHVKSFGEGQAWQGGLLVMIADLKTTMGQSQRKILKRLASVESLLGQTDGGHSDGGGEESGEERQEKCHNI
ncbi:hypothetical protein TWF481_011036 [Arthrobotrys musiformis]|uniref:Uncharacterized protein n=1 Tax=Arthrobotrys musiformis TaxID=47236 RepID=A0AAV9W369_9PEZI